VNVFSSSVTIIKSKTISMKKLLFPGLIMFSLFCFSKSSIAQNTGKVSLGINAGLTSITSDGGGSNFYFAGELAYLITPYTTILVNAGYITDVFTSITEITGNGRYYPSPHDRIRFFGEIGAGSYIISTDFLGLVKGSKSYFGINGGAGATANIPGNIDLTLKVKYHNPFTKSGEEKINWINTTFGVNVFF
jgi:hypothetical protein